MTIKSAKTLFSQDEIGQIEAAIAEVESKTSGEIVPVVATVSGRYDRSEDLFAFLFSLLSLSCCWYAFQGISDSTQAWSSGPALIVSLPIVLLILIVTFFIGIALASHFPILRLPLISKAEMQDEVEKRARESFQQLKIRNTEDATGILIYVSLYEHMVHVVGDDTINSKLNQSDWQAVCDTIIGGFSNKQPAQGLRDGILRGGELLAEHFPVKEGDTNELVDTLHLID